MKVEEQKVLLFLCAPYDYFCFRVPQFAVYNFLHFWSFDLQLNCISGPAATRGITHSDFTCVPHSRLFRCRNYLLQSYPHLRQTAKQQTGQVLLAAGSQRGKDQRALKATGLNKARFALHCASTWDKQRTDDATLSKTNCTWIVSETISTSLVFKHHD